MNSDIVYICNPTGYLGASVMLELGYLLASNKEVIFMEKPSEPIILQILIDNSSLGNTKVYTPNELVDYLKRSDEISKSRDWFDNNYHAESKFTL